MFVHSKTDDGDVIINTDEVFTVQKISEIPIDLRTKCNIDDYHALVGQRVIHILSDCIHTIINEDWINLPWMKLWVNPKATSSIYKTDDCIDIQSINGIEISLRNRVDEIWDKFETHQKQVDHYLEMLNDSNR